MKQLLILLTLSVLAGVVSAQTGKSEFKSVRLSKIPKPTNPAELVISDVVFSDESGNQDNNLDATEKSEIRFVLTNKGKGDAYSILLKVEELTGVKGLNFPKETLKGTLAAGMSIIVQIPITGEKGLQTSKCNFRISVKEGNSFDAEPFLVAVNTKSFRKPELIISDALFTNEKEEGKITLGEKVELDILLKNKGEGEARNVKIKFLNPSNVFPGARDEYTLPVLKPGEERKLNYEFFANKQYSDTSIPIMIKITEDFGEYGLSEVKKVSLDQTLARAETKVIEIIGNEEVVTKDTKTTSSLSSDVDRNIPVSSTVNDNVRVLIIGNEDYKKYQDELTEESNVDFARNDARIFREYCEKTFGIPAANIDYLPDATASKMKQSLNRLSLLISKKPDLEVIFFYAGHGLPDPITKEPYLIPVDVSGGNLENAIKLKDVYKKLGENPSSRVTVFVDACFSGGARNQTLTKDRAIKIEPNNEPLTGNMVVYTASSGTQSSLPYRDQKHGMFTYFLLKNLQQTKGAITYQQLGDALKKNVSFYSIDINKRQQDPQMAVSPEINQQWVNWKIKSRF